MVTQAKIDLNGALQKFWTEHFQYSNCIELKLLPRYNVDPVVTYREHCIYDQTPGFRTPTLLKGGNLDLNRKYLYDDPQMEEILELQEYGRYAMTIYGRINVHEEKTAGGSHYQELAENI